MSSKRARKRRVLLSGPALQKISAALQSAENRYEVGGVLLGHRRFRTFFVVDVVITAGPETCSAFSFVLDGELAAVQAEALAGSYRQRPAPIGVWHSHVSGIDAFSAQDRRSNRIFAQAFSGAVSMIVIPRPDAGLFSLTARCISPGGRESPCAAIRAPQRRIPKRFTDREEG